MWVVNFFQSQLFSFHDVNRNDSPCLKGRGLGDLSEYECAWFSDVPVELGCASSWRNDWQFRFWQFLSMNVRSVVNPLLHRRRSLPLKVCVFTNWWSTHVSLITICLYILKKYCRRCTDYVRDSYEDVIFLYNGNHH